MTGERLIVGAAIAGGFAGAFICIALESSGWVSGVFGSLGLLLLAGIADGCPALVAIGCVLTSGGSDPWVMTLHGTKWKFEGDVLAHLKRQYVAGDITLEELEERVRLALRLGAV